MYPQTHVFFAGLVLEKINDATILGSLFPDMIIGPSMGHRKAHSLGAMLLQKNLNGAKLDFVRAVITHGIDPPGLDYYGDEKFPGYELGYCFEKARPLVKETVKACNIPPEMGLWKAHNIIEMGIELLISRSGPYGQMIRRAFANKSLVSHLSQWLSEHVAMDATELQKKITAFPHYIEVFRATPESLANKYRIQMFTKHRININTTRVAELIARAAEMIEEDVNCFWEQASRLIKAVLP